MTTLSDPPSGNGVRRWAPLAVTVTLATIGGVVTAAVAVYDRFMSVEQDLLRHEAEIKLLRAVADADRDKLMLRVQRADEEHARYTEGIKECRQRLDALERRRP